jgi:hypothetical protein
MIHASLLAIFFPLYTPSPSPSVRVYDGAYWLGPPLSILILSTPATRPWIVSGKELDRNGTIYRSPGCLTPITPSRLSESQHPPRRVKVTRTLEPHVDQWVSFVNSFCLLTDYIF